MPDPWQPRSETDVLADTVASYLRRSSEWMADYRDAAAQGRGTAPNHLFYAAEAIVLAVLATEGIHVGRGEQHQLSVAIGKLPDENPMKAAMLPFAGLTRFATTFRYPSPAGRLKRADAKEVADFARSVDQAHRLAISHYGVDMSPGSTSAATNVAPLRP